MDIYVEAGQQAIVNVLAYIIFIGIALYALQGLRIEQLFKKGKTFHFWVCFAFEF